MTPSDLFFGSGLSITTGRSPWSAVGTYNVSIESLIGGGWLDSGCAGVGLVAMSSSVGPMVNGELLLTIAAKSSFGLSAGRRAMDHFLRLVM